MITVHSWVIPAPRWIAILVPGYGEQLGHHDRVLDDVIDFVRPIVDR